MEKYSIVKRPNIGKFLISGKKNSKNIFFKQRTLTVLDSILTY